MGMHELRMGLMGESLPKNQQLAWKLAMLAVSDATVDERIAGSVINHLIDNAALGLVAINQRSAANARSQAIAHPNSIHPRSHGATIIGLPRSRRCSAEWAAWANGVAIRGLSPDDVRTVADGTHPADSIPTVLAVAQQCGRDGSDLLRGIVTAFQVNLSLSKAVDVSSHGIDSVLHLAPAMVCGIGACLGLNADVIYQAIQQAVHGSVATHQGCNGGVSSWRAFAAAHVGKLAVEAVDRCMRGEDAPSPVYEGEDSVLVRMLDGADSTYLVELPYAGDCSAVLDCRPRINGADSRSGLSVGFEELTCGVVSDQERARFLNVVQRLPSLASRQLAELNVAADLVTLQFVEPDGRGIF